MRRHSLPEVQRLRQAPRPFVPRLASSFKDVERREIDPSQYPTAEQDSFVPSLIDIPYIQGILANTENFAQNSVCEIFELRSSSSDTAAGHWLEAAGDADVQRFLQKTWANTDNGSVRLRVVFCTLTTHPQTSFGHKLSLSRSVALQLLTSLDICPHFCKSLLGEPDYWAPLEVHSCNSQNQIRSSVFAFQHPRYTIHVRQQPCSIYIGYDAVRDVTTYVVSSGEVELFVERTKARLRDYFGKTLTQPAKVGPEVFDPFLVQSILCQESLLAARQPITELRHRLYDVLDVVGEYSKEPFDRSNLKEMTNKLHKVSQDADSLAVSVEMGLMIAQNSSRGWNAIRSSSPTRSKFGGSTVGDSLDYIARSLESQLRWLQSYKSRKDIAMNLVFNLVTQQDSETSTSIARDTKDDSASMKIIAVLTMIFLPATAVATFFGMSLLEIRDDGTLHISKMTWLYAVVTVLLTAAIFLFWLYWYSILRITSHWRDRQKKSLVDFKEIV
ncbi:hypothetical protein NW762_011124 [Fusarium torreyae]|uniref:Uncharacterized protein n=1 Tax=Fusarium torreyae TaxID=1237075 RepID=A0A9W8RPS5_9HYPO|nr:hypothetical protein NW762_011124 [Fusarium torreyae]